MKLIKVKPWGEGQGDHVLIDESEFNPDFHTLADGETAPASVLLIVGQGVADGTALQELIDKLNAERDGIVLLIDAAEGLSPLEHPGAGELPIRLFDALTAIREGVNSLKANRDELAGEVARLKALNEPVDNAEKIANLKALLDVAGVQYRANASLDALEKAVADLPKP